MASQIVAIRSRIEHLAESAERDVLLVGLASSIETVSKIRRDGRALRITEKPRTILKKVLTERWELMAQDIEVRDSKSHGCSVRTEMRTGVTREKLIAVASV